ncbi:hypothetical protein B0T16DRAFT_453346 [Cercophora newfieldiana]|uniref:Uncharacterized protein n=1 Tax=Cercophora newfieldiana TaxID=92897 RepID=A0AA39YSQ4_9PEZI|nr:hypothetical protein B0T16DRAFT_453346 [Cercophora newfieldiana]
MDEPADDPCWSWPHWKFGLKRNDLFTKLHDQYNTVPSAIQDPQAFHHDVYEISHEATSTDDFHRLLQDRKEQRLRELNESLESAAFEIIANPSLIGTEQWQHAVQLFRTKSLDSLVRYFASYLPLDHPWHKPSRSVSGSETSSTVDSVANSHSSIFDDGPIMTDEPLEMEMGTPYEPYDAYDAILPPSPRSMTTCSESSAASPMDIPHHDYDLNTMTPPRTLSYSESEPDLHEEEVSQPCEAESQATSVSVASEVDFDVVDKVIITTTNPEAPKDDSVSLFSGPDAIESETPTPKPERQAASFFEPKPSLPHRRHRIAPRPAKRPLATLAEAKEDGMYGSTEE